MKKLPTIALIGLLGFGSGIHSGFAEDVKLTGTSVTNQFGTTTVHSTAKTSPGTAKTNKTAAIKPNPIQPSKANKSKK